MSKLPAPFLALGAALLLGGCPIYGDSDGDPPVCVDFGCGRHDAGMPPPVDAGHASCRTHGDCAPGLYCDVGVCMPSGTCTDDDACDPGFWCDFRNTCVPRVDGECRGSADCTGDEVCVEGLCRTPEEVCQFGYECTGGRACVDNRCTEICATDGDCGAGESCEDSFCVPAPGECTTSAQCAAGEHCVDGRCFLDCEADAATCGARDACAEDAFCRPDWTPKPICEDDSGCADGAVCRDGVCRTPCDGTQPEAERNMNCQLFDNTLPICDVATNLCVSGTEPATPECFAGSDCDAGDRCVNAICR